jgi:hypothetical protein
MGKASRTAPPSLTRLLAGSGNELEEGLFTRALKDEVGFVLMVCSGGVAKFTQAA